MTSTDYKFGTWYPIYEAQYCVGTQYDVWVVERDARTFTQTEGKRIANATWRKATNKEAAEWCECKSPYWEAIETDCGGKATVITHFMPLPPPPIKEGDKD